MPCSCGTSRSGWVFLPGFEGGLVGKQVAQALDAIDQLPHQVPGGMCARRRQPQQLGLCDELRDQLVDLVELAAITCAQRPQLTQRADAQLCRRGSRCRPAIRELLYAELDGRWIEVGTREHGIELDEPQARLAQS